MSLEAKNQLMAEARALDRFPFADQARLPQAKKLSDKQLMLLWACFKSWLNRPPHQPQPARKAPQTKRAHFFRRKQDDANIIIDVEPI